MLIYLEFMFFSFASYLKLKWKERIRQSDIQKKETQRGMLNVGIIIAMISILQRELTLFIIMEAGWEYTLSVYNMAASTNW